MDTARKRLNWEGGASLVCALVVWILILAPRLIHRWGKMWMDNDYCEFDEGVVLICCTAFGIGFGISGLRTSSKMSKRLSVLALVMITAYAAYFLPPALTFFGQAIRKGDWQYFYPW